MWNVSAGVAHGSILGLLTLIDDIYFDKKGKFIPHFAYETMFLNLTTHFESFSKWYECLWIVN